jgi:hypothetical protein
MKTYDFGDISLAIGYNPMMFFDSATPREELQFLLLFDCEEIR